MCIIIAKDAGVDALDAAYFDRAWDANSHGGGLVWKTPEGAVMFQKGFMNKQEMLDKIAQINVKDNSFIAHFRIRSVGEVKAENCHPFVMQHVTFAHNGTLGIEPLPGKTDSETFGLAFLSDKPMSWIKEYQVLLEMALGTSKFAIMDNETGEILILNKDRGEERDGAWFSNRSAFPVEPVAATPYRYNTHWWDDLDDDAATTQAQKPKTTYVADKTFGTNRYSPAFQKWSDKLHTWVYASSGARAGSYLYMDTVAVNRKGLFELDKNITPGKDLPSQKYEKGDAIFHVIVACQSTINKELKDYYKQTFKSWQEREDAQEMISAMHFVLNCVRRLIAAGKEVCEETLYDFCELNAQRRHMRTNEYEGFDRYVEWNCQSFLLDYKTAQTRIEKAKA